MTKGYDGVLVLSCFLSDARFMYDFFSLLRFTGGSVEAELCPLIFLGLIFAVAAAAAAVIA